MSFPLRAVLLAQILLAVFANIANAENAEIAHCIRIAKVLDEARLSLLDPNEIHSGDNNESRDYVSGDEISSVAGSISYVIDEHIVMFGGNLIGKLPFLLIDPNQPNRIVELRESLSVNAEKNGRDGLAEILRHFSHLVLKECAAFVMELN